MSDDTKKYPFKSEPDTERLQRQHEVMKSDMGGNLVLAPIDLTIPEVQVLDAGTSDGYWLCDFRKDYPAPQVLVGTDIDASRFPTDMPEGISLIQQDMHDPWPAEWKGRFDFVHQRLLLVASRGDPQPFVNRLLEVVKPGGWVQMIEADQVIGEHDGQAMHQFLAIMTAMVNHIGTPLKLAHEMTRWLREAGCEKIGECVIPFSMGPAQRDPKLREQSVIAFLAGVSSLVQWGRMLPAIPGVSKEDLDTLVTRCEVEVRGKGGYYPMRCVWGQKPL